MSLKFVINPEAVTGEAIRFHLLLKGISARDMGNELGIHEGNISYIFSRGQKMKKGYVILPTDELSEEDKKQRKTPNISFIVKSTNLEN